MANCWLMVNNNITTAFQQTTCTGIYIKNWPPQTTISESLFRTVLIRSDDPAMGLVSIHGVETAHARGRVFDVHHAGDFRAPRLREGIQNT